MDPQLQDGEHPTIGFVFQLLKRIEIPRIDHNRLFTNGMRPDPKGHPDVRVVQVVGCTDAHVVDAIFGRTTSKLLQMSIESLDFLEVAHVEGVPDRERRPRRAGPPPRPADCRYLESPSSVVARRSRRHP